MKHVSESLRRQHEINRWEVYAAAGKHPSTQEARFKKVQALVDQARDAGFYIVGVIGQGIRILEHEHQADVLSVSYSFETLCAQIAEQGTNAQTISSLYNPSLPYCEQALAFFFRSKCAYSGHQEISIRRQPMVVLDAYAEEGSVVLANKIRTYTFASLDHARTVLREFMCGKSNVEVEEDVTA